MIRLLVIGRGAAEWGRRLLDLAPDITIDTARLPAAGVRQLTKTPPDAVLIVEASNPERANALVEAVRAQPLGALTPIVLHGEGIDPTLDIQAALSSTDGASEVLRSLEEALEFDVGELSASAQSIVTMETPRRQPNTFADEGRDERTDRAPTAENPAIGPEYGGAATRGSAGAHQERAQTPGEGPAPGQAASHGSGHGTGHPARLETPKFILEEIVDEEPDGPRKLDRGDLFGSRTRRRSQSDVDEATVKRMLRAVRHEDYYAILGLHRGAETPAVRDAYYRQIERFEPQSVDVDIAHRHHLELAEIRDALEDAWAVLGDGDLRADYLDATTRG